VFTYCLIWISYGRFGDCTFRDELQNGAADSVFFVSVCNFEVFHEAIDAAELPVLNQYICVLYGGGEVLAEEYLHGYCTFVVGTVRWSGVTLGGDA